MDEGTEEEGNYKPILVMVTVCDDSCRKGEKCLQCELRCWVSGLSSAGKTFIFSIIISLN